MSKISITVDFTEAEFKRMIKEVDWKITDQAKFQEIIHSKKFAKALALDLKQVWIQTNEDSGDMDMVLQGLGLVGCTEAGDLEYVGDEYE